jgi:hypothetical protein
MERWHNKVRLFRKKANGRSANVEADIRRRKEKLSAE